MITSSSAIASLEWLFEQALRSNSVVGEEDQFSMTIQAPRCSTVGSRTNRLFVLSISSYVIRIIALFEFGTDAATAAHFAKLMNLGDVKLEGQALLDVFGEYTNRVCGEVNRRLQESLGHTGMSTPFILENTCLEYLSLLSSPEVRWFKVVINDSVCFNYILCVCIDNGASVDLNIDQSVQEDVSSGELELF